MVNTKIKTPSPEELERAGRLREIFAVLSEANKRFPVIVEGKKDALALRKIGLAGDIILLHRGKGIYEFCEEVSEHYTKVILLLDWDEKGESLYKLISQHLRGQHEEFSAFRGIIKMLCQKEIRDIEGIPKLLGRLEGEDL